MRPDRWKSAIVVFCSHIYKKNHDVTKTRKGKTEQLLRVDDHDFTMRPAFGGEEQVVLLTSYSYCVAVFLMVFYSPNMNRKDGVVSGENFQIAPLHSSLC